MCVSEKFALRFNLSARNHHDAPEGRKLIKSIDSNVVRYLIMDRAYEDDKTRDLALKRLVLVVPPKKIENLPGNMTRNYINVVTKLSVFSFVLNDFEKFLLATINLILYIFLL